MTDKQLIYVGDPMCSWCWGFSPVKTALIEKCAGRAEVALLTGGLRAFTTEPTDDARKTFLRDHWQEIGARTGQPFAYSILDRDDFVYDTEPPCRAAVVARELTDDWTALRFFAAIQHAFYAESRDVTQADVLQDVAREFGLDEPAFGARFDTEESREATVRDFQAVQSLGIRGFPAMVVREGDKLAYLTNGYQPLESVGPLLEHWLTHGFENQVAEG